MTTPWPIWQFEPIRTFASTVTLCPQSRPASICALGCSEILICPPETNRHSILFQRTLCRLDDLDHPQSVSGVAAGVGAIDDTIEKVLALDFQGLCGRNPGNADVAKPNLNGFAIAARLLRRGATVV